MEMKKYYLIIKKLNLNEIHYFSEEKFSLFLLQQWKGKRI